MQDFLNLSISELLNSYKEGAKAEDVVKAHLNQIESTEPEFQALLHISGEYALEKARYLDKNKPEKLPLLYGVPVTIKDALCTKGIPTTAGSRILENFVPPYSSTAVNKLEEAGAIILGKNNMDEFAMGSSCENSAYQATKNPHNVKKVPGGSSGGSAASVVAKQCYASLGTDTGGSVRQPAALCGCVGIKPTYGRISRYGVIAYASSLDQVGVFTRSAMDAALVLEAISGHDHRDSTSSQEKVPSFSKAVLEAQSLKGVKIGIPKEFLEADIDKEMAVAYKASIAKAQDLGAELVDITLPHTKYALATYYIVATAEASSNLARYDGVRYGHRASDIKNLEELYIKSRTEGFGAEVQRRILLGSFVLSAGYYDAYYKKAAQVRRLIQEDFLKAYEKCSLILSPVSPLPAWDIGQVQDPIQMYLMDIFTLSLNLAGLPGIAFPVGTSSAGLPLGMQLLGRAFDEAHLLSTAKLLMV